MKEFNIDLDKEFSGFTAHCYKRDKKSSNQIKETLIAVRNSNMQHLIIFPNNDAGSKNILKAIKQPNLNYRSTLTLREYKTLLSGKMILVGNSSSGIRSVYFQSSSSKYWNEAKWKVQTKKCYKCKIL